MRVSYVHVILILLIKNFCVSQFHQHDYNIEQDRLEIPEFNKSVVKNSIIKVFKYNNIMTQKAINFSINLEQAVHKNILLSVSVYKSVQKVYRMFPFPNFTLDLCDEYAKLGEKNPLGMQLAICRSNFRGCPIGRGNYYINSWVIEQEKFPPHLPGGDYKIRIHVAIDDTIFLLVVEWYGSVMKKKRKGIKYFVILCLYKLLRN